MSDDSPGFLGDLQRILQQHLRAVSGPEGEAHDPEPVRAHLHEVLLASGLSAEAVEAICRVFDDYVIQLEDIREQYSDIEEQLDRLRASSARRLGRVTRVIDEFVNGRPAVGIFVEDSDFMILPVDSKPPKVGETIQFARGENGDALYFGSCGFDHVGLVTATLKQIESFPDGRTHVEVALRDQGDPGDVVVAVASEQLAAALPDLPLGSRVRVTDGHVRVAFTAPQPDADAERRANPIYTIYDPIRAEDDNFIYQPDVLERLDSLIDIFRCPELASQHNLEMPQAIALAGPSGTGKTTIVERYLSRGLSDAGFLTLRVHPERLTSQWYGVTEKLIAEVLDAGGDRNALICFNEVDSLMPKRGGGQTSTESDIGSRVFATVAEMLGRKREPGTPLRLIAFTTNYVSRLDMALRSRLDDVIPVGLPDLETSQRILAAYLRKMDLDEDPVVVAQNALSDLGEKLVTLVFDSSDETRHYSASDMLSGRTIEQAVQASARAALRQRTKLSAFSLASELKRQLYGNVADMRQEDLMVAVGLPMEEARRVASVHVYEKTLTEACTPRTLRLRFRNAS